MKRPYWAAAAGALALAAAARHMGAAPSLRQPAAAPRVPVIVELFTSEGCSSCPPADAVLTRLVSTQPVPGAEIIALGEHVDYWDPLGWRDPFSSADFSARQSEYARAFHSESRYTPQMIVDGRDEFAGSDYALATAAVARAVRQTKPAFRLSIDGERVSNASGSLLARVEAPEGTSRTGAADVLVAVTEDGLFTDVRRGENGGRQLRHSAVVRSLVRVGTVPAGPKSWSVTSPLHLASAWNRNHLRIVAFAQDRASRKILAAAAAARPTP